MTLITSNGFQRNRRDFIRTLGKVGGATLILPKIARSAVSGSTEFPDLAALRSIHTNKGVISPDQTYRMMEWALHFPPQGKFEFDLEGAMKLSREVGSEAMMFYTQDHWGYALYPSEVGTRHPNLKNDFFGAQVALARQNGMSVVAYYSLLFNNQIVLTHKDWAWVDEKGEPQRMRWYLPCLDSPYRQYALDMIEEIVSHYDVDELFLDIFGIQFYEYQSKGRNPFCFCKYTEAAWERDHPGDPYREGFDTTEGWQKRYQWHQRRTMIDMLEEIIGRVRKHRPKLLVALNGGPESFPNEIMQKVSFIYAEPLPCPTGIALGSILMRGWGRSAYQAGAFTLWPYIDELPVTPFRVQVDALILQNARVFFVGEAPLVAHLDGRNFSTRWFERVGEAFADVRNVDCLFEGIEPVYSTAMFYSESTRKEFEARKRPVDFRSSTLGALETLTYAGRPVESLPEFRLSAEMLSHFELLVLPEVEVLSDGHAELIRQWVGNGGTLVGSFKCGLLDQNRLQRAHFPLADVFGLEFLTEERRYAYDQNGNPRPVLISTYLEPAGHELAQMFGKTTVGLPGTFLNVRRTTASEVMRYRLPFMVEDLPNNQWYNHGPPPPGAQLGGTAIALNQYGKGQAVYIGVPIFWAMKDRPFWIRKWIPDLLHHLIPNPLAELRPEPFSEYVHGTFFYDQSKRFILVQVLNTVELATQGEIRPGPKVNIRVDPTRLKVIAARTVWPKEQNLPVVTENGRTQIVLENPERYTVLFLKLS